MAGGRPQAESAARRDVHFAVRLSPVERAELDARAAAVGLSASDYARAVLVEGVPPKPARRVSSRPVMTPEELAAFNRAGVDFRGAANNLNQIARALNSNAPRPILDELAEELGHLRASREQLDALFARALSCS